MHSDIINLQSKNMGIIFFQASYSRKKLLQQQLLMISCFVRFQSHIQIRIHIQHQLSMNCTKYPFKMHTCTIYVPPFFLLCIVVWLIYQYTKMESVFIHTRNKYRHTPLFSFFPSFSLLYFLFHHSSERTDEKFKETRKDPKLTDQCRQPYKDQNLSPNMIHNPC